jgi:probable DNA repair protein
MDVTAAPPAQLLQSRVREALARGATVLTANQRAARTLRRAFDLHRRDLGFTDWPPPAILAWDAWLGSLWHRLLLDGHASALLLNPAQERALWQNIIAADPQIASLRPIDALAETAASAWSLLHAYRGRWRLDVAADTSDTRAYVRWAATFERQCRERNYLSQAELCETLRAAVGSEQLPLPPELLLIGFDFRTPAQMGLLDAIGEAGARIHIFDPKLPGNSSIATASALDAHEELYACARWLRERLSQQPGSRLAVVVPSIEAEHCEIDRVFRQVLAPECNDIAAPAGAGPYEFSLGIPLAHAPLIATALDVLRWTIAPLPLDRVTALLLSPHLAPVGPDPAEQLARAEFDAFALRQRHLLVPEVSLDALTDLVITWQHASHLPVLSRQLRALQAAVRRGARGPAERTHSEWAAAMHDLLDAAGWNQSDHDSSIEFQTCRKWESALDELATLDFEGRRVNFAAALAALERIAAQTLFAPESRHAPIQIIGPFEAAGSAFDGIWFLRANDLTWPSIPATNPLLPWRLQRDLAMPGTDPARDFELARRITARIAASAPTVFFSYAEQTADGHQRPSPVLAGLAAESCDAREIAPAEGGPAPVVLEDVLDDAPIPPPPDRPLEGGATILAAQAACGFRAFAEKRLFSSALEPGSLGLDARERGKLVHVVLERFWEQVETQAALKRMTTSERDALLGRSIDEALAKYRLDAGWPRAYLSAEHQRLLNLLRLWLDFEASERPPFAVKSREADLKDVRVGPLRLNVRVDRVDAILIDGEPAGEIILDYKTGAAKPADWLGDRPDAPQLPLYAVVSGSQETGGTQPLAAIAFASLRPGEEMGLNGFEARDGLLPKAAKLAAETLDAQVAEWRTTLTALAEEFHSGQASVSPKRYPQTCQYCRQRLLCRLDPSALNPDVLDPEPYLDVESEASDADPSELEADLA